MKLVTEEMSSKLNIARLLSKNIIDIFDRIFVYNYH